MIKTESDEEVIFVSEKSVPKPSDKAIDTAKRLALQKDIDQESQPRLSAKLLVGQKMVAVEMPVGKVKKKIKVAKTDEESVKENPAKKERKSKRGQATAPEREASAIDEESVGGIKKKNIVTESDANCHDVKEKNGNDKGISKKKIKKKLQSEEENAGEIAQGSVKEERGVENEDRKQKRIKKKSLQFEPVEEIVTGQGGEKEGAEKQVGKDEVLTKAKKRKTKALVESTEEQSKERKKRQNTTEKKEKKTAKPTEESEDRTVVAKKSKKSDENEQRLVTQEEKTDVVEDVTVKKKPKTERKAATKEEAKETKRKKAGKELFNAVTNEEMEEKEIKHKKRSKSTNGVKDILEEERGEPERKKKKGLKEKGGKVSVQREEEQEGGGIEEKEPMKKKRKKASSKGEEEETSLQLKQVKEEGQSMETHDTKGKKKNRKKSSEVEMKVANEKEAEEGVETLAKKRKKQQKKIKLEPMGSEEQGDQGVPQMEVVFLSEKTGNTDEVTINQERRLALQMEIDKASEPQKPAKPSGFGQWGTAQFDSSQQQQKFLRLMGGFKKGTQPTGANTGQANMALGKEAQQDMQQGLLGEFERAQSRRMDFNGRGAGLGFTAPSNKMFSIDINASRSVHFD